GHRGPPRPSPSPRPPRPPAHSAVLLPPCLRTRASPPPRRGRVPAAQVIYSSMMIIRGGPNELMAITQPDHARLAGVFAEAWRDHAGPSLVAASHHHDDGWIAWEEFPTTDGRGRPHDFLTIPMDQRVAVYRRGIDLLAKTDLHAGLLTSLHFGRLLAEGLGALEGDALSIAGSFLAQQATWEEQVRRELG